MSQHDPGEPPEKVPRPADPVSAMSTAEHIDWLIRMLDGRASPEAPGVASSGSIDRKLELGALVDAQFRDVIDMLRLARHAEETLRRLVLLMREAGCSIEEIVAYGKLSREHAERLLAGRLLSDDFPG